MTNYLHPGMYSVKHVWSPLQAMPCCAQCVHNRMRTRTLPIVSHFQSRAPAQVPFAACLEKWAAPEMLEGVAGPGGGKRTVVRQTRFATFPPYLLVQMRRRAPLSRSLLAVFAPP